MIRCRVLLGVAIAIWAIGASPEVAGSAGAQDTVRSLVGAVPQVKSPPAKAPPSSLPPVEVPSVPQVTGPPGPPVTKPPGPKVTRPPELQVTKPPGPKVTSPTPPVSKAPASTGPVSPVADLVTGGPGAAADPSDRNRASGDVGGSPGIPDVVSGKSRASRGGPGGAATDPHRVFSTPPGHRHQWVASNVKAPLPRWLAYVWPAAVLGRGDIVITTLGLILSPEAVTPLLISAPLALLGLSDAADSIGPASGVKSASAGNEPSTLPVDDVALGVDPPSDIEMLLLLAVFLTLSCFIFWFLGMGSPGKHRQGRRR